MQLNVDGLKQNLIAVFCLDSTNEGSQNARNYLDSGITKCQSPKRDNMESVTTLIP